MFRLSSNSYGKQQVRVSYVDRQVEPHTYCRLTVDTDVSGRFDRAYTEGRNEEVLPTDTMRAAVFNLLEDEGFPSPEAFALTLGRYLIDAIPAADDATVEIRSERWDPIPAEDGPFPDAFVRQPGDWRATAELARTHGGEVWGGIDDLPLAKTDRSAFRNFLRDDFTVLQDDDDRIVGTTLNAAWKYADTDLDFAAVSESVRAILLYAFAAHTSESLQHTLFEMGCDVLRRCQTIERVRMQLPNYHHTEPASAGGGSSAAGKPLVLRFEDAPSGRIEGEVARPTE